MQFYTYRLCNQHLQTKIESFFFCHDIHRCCLMLSYCYIIIIFLFLHYHHHHHHHRCSHRRHRHHHHHPLFSNCNPPCTLHYVPAHLILYIPAVYMNLGHISPYFCPHCQSCDFIVLIKINAIPANITDNCCPLSWIVYLYDWLIFFVQLWQ